jgi:hypothetical protein
MVALKGYFDDSGDVRDPSHSFFSIAGYLAEVASWHQFEPAWQAALADPDEPEFSVAYLHMKELVKGVGEFSRWRPDDPKTEPRIGRLLSRLASVIVNLGLGGFCAVISLRDLDRFNSETGRDLDPKALAVYASLLELRKVHETDDMELVLDRMDGAHAAIALAEEYGQTDSFHPFMRNFPAIMPLSKNGTNGCRNTPALQAADFLAWEVRKQCEQRKKLLGRVSPSDPTFPQQVFQSFLVAKIEAMKRKGLQSIDVPAVPQRRSLTALADAPTEGFLYDYAAIRRADEVRNGVWRSV